MPFPTIAKSLSDDRADFPVRIGSASYVAISDRSRKKWSLVPELRNVTVTDGEWFSNVRLTNTHCAVSVSTMNSSERYSGAAWVVVQA